MTSREEEGQAQEKIRGSKNRKERTCGGGRGAGRETGKKIRKREGVK